jgi:hypothetical protein
LGTHNNFGCSKIDIISLIIIFSVALPATELFVFKLILHPLYLSVKDTVRKFVGKNVQITAGFEDNLYLYCSICGNTDHLRTVAALALHLQL